MKSTLLCLAFCLAVLVGCVSPLTAPKGYLLVFKTHNISSSLFRVDFNGSVQKYWDYTLDDVLSPANLFAVNTKKQLVYLGKYDHFLALDLTTGKVAVKMSFFQYFWNYDYIEEDNAIYGACTANLQLNWCRITLEPSPTIEIVNYFPGTGSLAPTADVYYMDKVHQSIWYFTVLGDAVGTNYTIGRQFFHGKESYTDTCILHDHKLNRTFAVTDSQVLTEIPPLPKKEKKLLALPSDVRLASVGMCTYDQDTHTAILLVSSASNYLTDAMPTQLLFIDVVSLNTKSVALPEFRQWKSPHSVSAVKYIFHTKKT